MKKLFTLMVVAAFTLNVFAQTPQKMSYQAVVRNTSGELIPNQAIGMKISILQGSETGTVVFSETYSPNPQTNANGLVTVVIGSGTASVGSLSDINWGAGPYFLKTETDPSGGTSYTITGTSQLLSVPYAMHAMTVESLASETDPLFSASPAKGITSGNITNWNTAYGWGNHSGLYRPVSWTPTWADVTGKPAFAAVATSGIFADLLSKPTTLAGYGITDADNSNTNEIQTLNLSGTQLSLSLGGGTVTLPSSGGGDNWGTQTVVSNNTLTGAGTTASPLAVANSIITPSWSNIQNVPAGFADGIDNVDDADNNITNEIQTLSLSGTLLSLSLGGGTVTLPASGEGGDNWGTQTVVTDATLSGNGTTATPLRIADNGVTSAKIADGAVGTVDLANSSVTSAKILDGTIVAADIADGTVATADLANSAVTNDKLGNLSVSAVKIQNGAVTSEKLAANAVISNTISTGAVTGIKIAQAGATAGQVLKWDGTIWSPANDETGGSSGLELPYSGSLSFPSEPVFSIINTGNGSGIKGKSNATSGVYFGVIGESSSIAGYGVYGGAPHIGVEGIAHAPDGIGINGYAYDLEGENYAIRGVTNSSNGYSGFFQGGRFHISGNTGIGVTNPTAKLEVAGQVKITGGSPGAGKVLTSDAYGLASWQTVSGGLSLPYSGDCSSTSPAFSINQSGTGQGIYVYNPAESGDIITISAHNNSSSGTGIGAYMHANSGIATGITGFTMSPGGTGVKGIANSSTGLNYAVIGESKSNEGTGVYGISSSTTGIGYAIKGVVSSSSSYSGFFNGGKFYVNGNAGFGVSNPTQKLHIKGSTPGNAVLFIEPNQWTAAGDYGEVRFGDANHYIRGEHTTGMTFYDANKFNFSGGKVGIGTATPGYKLDVAGDRIRLVETSTSDWIALRTDGASNDFLDLSYGGGSLVIQGATTNENIIMNPSMNRVGIRTWNPQYDLDVNGNIRAIGSVYYGGTTTTAGTPYNKPDYVFGEEYIVFKTEEVEVFLEEKRHLPWVTSVEQEKKENGEATDMTRMAFETLESVENLQLQIIEMDKKIKALNEMILSQQAHIEKLENLKR